MANGWIEASQNVGRFGKYQFEASPYIPMFHPKCGSLDWQVGRSDASFGCIDTSFCRKHRCSCFKEDVAEGSLNLKLHFSWQDGEAMRGAGWVRIAVAAELWAGAHGWVLFCAFGIWRCHMLLCHAVFWRVNFQESWMGTSVGKRHVKLTDFCTEAKAAKPARQEETLKRLGYAWQLYRSM